MVRLALGECAELAVGTFGVQEHVRGTVGEPWVQQKMTMKIRLVLNAQSYLDGLPLVLE